DRTPPNSESAAKITVLKTERKNLQDEKKSIEADRLALDRLPKTWAALSTPPVSVKVLKRGDVLSPGDDAPPGALSAISLPVVRRVGKGVPCADQNQPESPPQPSPPEGGSDGDIGISCD